MMMKVEFVSEPGLVKLGTLQLWQPFRRQGPNERRLHLRGPIASNGRITCPSFAPDYPGGMGEHSGEYDELVHPMEITAVKARFIERMDHQE